MTESAVSAVIFDWGGTLTPWHTVDPIEGWLAAVGDPALAHRLHAAERAVWGRQLSAHQSATLLDVFAAADVDRRVPCSGRRGVVSSLTG